jgi:FkbM family methyltransferase
MKKISDFLAKSLPRDMVWRTGRSLYLAARKETCNEISTDGEALLQHCIVDKAAELKEPLVIFDAGANVGDWTNHFLGLLPGDGAAGKWSFHLFEPVGETFAVLSRGIRPAYREAVSLNNVALSSAAGEAEIGIVDHCGGRNSLHASGNLPIINRERITLTTLDAYVEGRGIDKIHFMKCDTEGHDMSVIEGAADSFKNEKILAFQLEYGEHWIYSRRFLKDLFDYFEGTPYSIGKLVPDGVEIYPQWHPELERFFLTNFLILHDSAKDWFPCTCGSFDRSNTYRAGN